MLSVCLALMDSDSDNPPRGIVFFCYSFTKKILAGGGEGERIKEGGTLAYSSFYINNKVWV